MARATFVKKARKDIPQASILAGESYYWWKFRFGGKHYSKTAPRRSQLTQSEFQAMLWDTEDRIGALEAGSGLADEVQAIADDIRQLGDEQTEKRDNMPEGLQQGPTGELLEGRASSCEDWATELEGVEFGEPDEAEIRADAEGDVGEFDADVWDSREEWEAEVLEKVEELTAAHWDAQLEAVQQCEYQGE